MRRLALFAGLTFGAWIGYRWGWLDGADYVEAWAATEADDLANLCSTLDCTPHQLQELIRESCERLDGRRVA